MKRATLWLCAILFVLTISTVAKDAEASHFQYGNITWHLPDPVNDPLTVEFTVTTGWRSTSIGSTDLDFGDGSANGKEQGTQIGGGVGAGGDQYSIYQYTTTHTYAAFGSFTAFFSDCCRSATLINASNSPLRVEATVHLDPDGTNTSGPISGVPVIIQFEVDTINQFILPVIDPDNDSHTCRFSTQAESGIHSANHPPTLPGGDTLHFIAPGCSIQWDGSVGANPGDRYAVSIAVESEHKGQLSKASVDYIIEWVPQGTKPACDGGGNFVANVGENFSHNMMGTDPQGDDLTLDVNNLPPGATTTPGLPATQAQPFAATFDWTPTAADIGPTFLVQFTYTDPTNISDHCTLIIQVRHPDGLFNDRFENTVTRRPM